MKTKRENAAIIAAVEVGELRLSFSNGEVLFINPDKLTPEIVTQATLHGLKQKLVDAAAISRNPDTGRSATIEDKFDAVKTVYDRLLAGSWNAVREGGGNAGGLLFRALCRMYEGRKTAEDIKTYLESKTDAEKAALRKNPKVAAIIDTLRAEKEDANDAEELLAELED
jgi:hypothetical protein